MNIKSFDSLKKSVIKVIASLMTVCMVFVFVGNDLDASAANNVYLTAPKMVAETRYDGTDTHPYNRQTNTLTVRWNKVRNATSYQVYIKGGKYKNWTLYKRISNKYNYCTATNLSRATSYYFAVRAVNGRSVGPFSYQLLKTARMNFDSEGWQAMCRIVYHEVGQINDSMWDKPMVYVSDCVVNRFVAAKYGWNNVWVYEYRNYSNIQSIIYNSGGFMSSAGLANDGATYGRVPARVKTAVYGAVYAKPAYKNIQNDMNVYFWCNTGYRPTSSKVAYVFSIPWGYFAVWRSYWG